MHAHLTSYLLVLYWNHCLVQYYKSSFDSCEYCWHLFSAWASPALKCSFACLRAFWSVNISFFFCVIVKTVGDHGINADADSWTPKVGLFLFAVCLIFQSEHILMRELEKDYCWLIEILRVKSSQFVMLATTGNLLQVSKGIFNEQGLPDFDE